MRATAKSVAQAIRDLRVHQGETQEEFAKKIGVNVSTLVRYETFVQQPKYLIIAKLAQHAQNIGLPDTALFFQEVYKEKGEKAYRTKALRSAGIIPRFDAIKQSTERLTKESERLIKTIQLRVEDAPNDPEIPRILNAAKPTLDALTRTIEHLKRIVEQRADPNSGSQSK